MSLHHATSHALPGSPRARDAGLMAEALASIPIHRTASVQIVDEAVVMRLAKDQGLDLRRVAGNIYESPASRDYWAVRDGKLCRLVGNTVVDDNETLDPANVDDHEATLSRIMAELEF